MKVLITGGAGYVGYALVKQLMFAPEVSEIIVYDNLSRKSYAFFDHQKFIEKPIRFVQADILDGRRLAQEMNGVDVVYHLAAKVTTPFADVDAHSFDQINHWGTAQVVYAAENASVQQFIYLSSVSVYGNTQEPIDESYAPHPQSYYAIAKLAGEEQVRRLSPKMTTHIIRSGNVYGYNPAYRIDAVINRFVFEAQFQGRVSIHGTGEQNRSFIHIDKLGTVLRQLIQHPLASDTFNLAEHNLSVIEVVELLRELYPDLETISLNSNMPRRNIAIQLPCRLLEHVRIPAVDLLTELRAFQAVFGFKTQA